MSDSAARAATRSDTLARFAMMGAAMMLAHQVAGKAARDGLFLSQYSPSDLPKIVSLAAATALVTGYGFSRLMERAGPRRLVPAAFAISGFIHLAEWLVFDFWPGITAVAVYLHIVALGAILLSGFWSLTSELFDPREARKRFGSIAAAGTAGGIAGGLLAERIVSLLSAQSILALLAILHICCAPVLTRMRPMTARPRRGSRPLRNAGEVFRQAPFLWSLAALVLLGTASAAILDYLYKSNAAELFGRGPGLVRFFALFHTTSQILTFAVQGIMSRVSLEKLGLGRTIASLPLATGAGSLTALLVPIFPAIASVRSLELILRGSLFRSGYELFFTPVSPQDKRSAKTIIDVGCDRLGDAAGAGFVQLAIFLGPAAARAEILTIAMLLSAISVWVALRLDRAYVGVLEKGLIDRATELDLADVQDPQTLSVVLRSIPQIATVVEASAHPAIELVKPARDPLQRALADLRSGDPARVASTLDETRDAVLIPQVIRLLGWDEACEHARRNLESFGPSIAGQLADSLLNPAEDFSVRRRIPRLLARCGTQRAVDGLVEGLNDARFEVRFQSGRALDFLAQRYPELRYPRERVMAIVENELSSGRAVWESHRLLDGRDGSDSGDGYQFLDELLRERANHTLEHVFSLLAIILPREPLKVAFRALHTTDKLLHGLALEYLDSVLPASVREKIAAVVEAPQSTASRPPDEVAAQLLRSTDSIALQLRRRARET